MTERERPPALTDEQWANKHFRNGYLNSWDWTAETRPWFGKENKAMWDAGVRLRNDELRDKWFRWQFASAGKGMKLEDV